MPTFSSQSSLGCSSSSSLSAKSKSTQPCLRHRGMQLPEEVTGTHQYHPSSGKRASGREELWSKIRLWECFSETSSCPPFLYEGPSSFPPSCQPGFCSLAPSFSWPLIPWGLLGLRSGVCGYAFHASRLTVVSAKQSVC